MDKDRILLFIPAYNCEKQVTRVLAQLDAKAFSFIDEVIVVNNRSTDGTEQAVMEYTRRHPGLPIKLLRNDENYGLGGSHKAAFQYAFANNFDYIIVLHGDDQGHITDILPILKSGKFHDYDCCLGARFKRGSRLAGYSRFRTFGNIVYNAMFSVVAGRVIYDLGSGLNMYKVDMLRNQFYLKYPDNLTFNYCMILGTIACGYKYFFFPISWREDDQVSNVKMVKQAFYVLGILFRYFWKREKYLAAEFREKARAGYPSKVIHGDENTIPADS